VKVYLSKEAPHEAMTLPPSNKFITVLAQFSLFKRTSSPLSSLSGFAYKGYKGKGIVFRFIIRSI
jgi:hypothetical protein